jgi:hypothetical protein
VLAVDSGWLMSPTTFCKFTGWRRVRSAKKLLPSMTAAAYQGRLAQYGSLKAGITPATIDSTSNEDLTASGSRSTQKGDVLCTVNSTFVRNTTNRPEAYVFWVKLKTVRYWTLAFLLSLDAVFACSCTT